MTVFGRPLSGDLLFWYLEFGLCVKYELFFKLILGDFALTELLGVIDLSEVLDLSLFFNLEIFSMI
jgi:hypothetical protein